MRTRLFNYLMKVWATSMYTGRILDMLKYNYQYTGKKYREVFIIAKEIAQKLKKSGA